MAAQEPGAKPDLLRVLDALVRRDGARPLFSGRIALGVLPADAPSRWWLAEFGQETKTSFPSSIPVAESDVLVVMSPEAEWFLLSGERAVPAEEPAVIVFGDGALIERFVHRYLDYTKGIGHQMMRVQARPANRRPAGEGLRKEQS